MGAAWGVAVSMTILARLAAYSFVGRREIYRWMQVYAIGWYVTVITAYWDAHEEKNPFHQWASGATLHYLASGVLFVIGGSESYCLNVDRVFPGERQQVKCFLGVYILTYCCCFVANKKISLPIDLGKAILPLFEHGM